MSEKVLICYGTRYGTTAEVTEAMATTLRELGHTAEVVNIKKQKPSSGLDEYSLVLVGSGIQAGRWTKEPLKFLEKNQEKLANTRLALFVVCAYAANPDKCDTVQSDFLDAIVDKFPSLSFTSTAYFAGMFDMEKYSLPVRAIVKQIIKGQLGPGEEVPEKIDFRDWEQIKEWTVSLV